ncbi:hypothetical protein [Chitinibacter sp. S2-10]|uniref:hypothetical protein n=1 Tax=Chitinibacter sp. S2-10 TaxID=3373597 RepID=UPI00397753D0
MSFDSAIRKYSPFIGCISLVFIAHQRQALMLAWFILPFLVIAYFIELVKCISGHTQWQEIRLKLFCWIVGYALVIGIHEYRAQQDRMQAEQVIVKIQTYKAIHHHYPRTLEELAFSNSISPIKIRFFFLKNRPMLSYLDSKHLYALHIYDFEVDTWKYVIP